MTIFSQLADFLGPYVGGSVAAGFLLGTGTIIVFLIGFVLMFGKDILNKQSGTILLLMGLILVSNPVVNWYPLYVPFLVVLALAFSYWQKYL